jgi:hypothetical protein
MGTPFSRKHRAGLNAMLLHIRPRLYSPFKHVALVKLGIEPFGVEFQADELRTGRPYPNRWYAVGCLRRGRKAVDGILIETPEVVDEFRCVARWAVDAELVVTHRIDYKVIDHDFDAVSDSMVLWHATMDGWSNRVPMKDVAPVNLEPMMETEPRQRPDSRRWNQDLIEGDWIIYRHEIFSMPTIERERITKPRYGERMPSPEVAFRLE